MALFFATGSLCFLVGPFPGYAQLVGASADAATFFGGPVLFSIGGARRTRAAVVVCGVRGSVLFAIGGALQTWLAWPQRRGSGAGRAAWWTATIQSAGT